MPILITLHELIVIIILYRMSLSWYYSNICYCGYLQCLLSHIIWSNNTTLGIHFIMPILSTSDHSPSSDFLPTSLWRRTSDVQRFRVLGICFSQRIFNDIKIFNTELLFPNVITSICSVKCLFIKSIGVFSFCWVDNVCVRYKVRAEAHFFM